MLQIFAALGALAVMSSDRKGREEARRRLARFNPALIVLNVILATFLALCIVWR